MNLSNLRRRLTTAEKTDQPWHYLTPEEVEAEIQWVQAGNEPRVERSHIVATITNVTARLHDQEGEAEGHTMAGTFQSCPVCRERLVC